MLMSKYINSQIIFTLFKEPKGEERETEKNQTYIRSEMALDGYRLENSRARHDEQRRAVWVSPPPHVTIAR